MADRIEIEISAINNASRVFDTVINSVAKISPSFATAAQGVATFAAENAAMIGVVAGAGIALFDFEKKAVKVALEYNQAVHQLSLTSGESMESSSRLIQVFDDFKISTEQLTPIIKAMTKEGLSPTVDVIAKLSDEYKAIQDPVAKDAFLFKNFGRAGADLALVMDAGSEKILKMSAATSTSLIATNETYQASEKYRLALDGVSDAMQGLSVVAGNDLLPKLADALEVVADLTVSIADNYEALKEFAYWTTHVADPLLFLTDAMGEGAKTGRDYKKSLESNKDELILLYGARRHYTDAEIDAADAARNGNAATDSATQSYIAMGKATEKTTEELKAEADAIAAVSKANNDLLSLTMTIQGEINSYSESLANASAAQTEAAKTLAEVTAEHEKRPWKTTAEDVAAAQAKYDDAGASIDELKQKHAAAFAQIGYDLLMAKFQVGGFTDAEFNAAQDYAVATGLITLSSAEMAKAMNADATAVNNGQLDIATFAARVSDGYTEVANTATTASANSTGAIKSIEDAFDRRDPIVEYGAAIKTAADTGTGAIGETQNALTSFSTEVARDESAKLGATLDLIPSSVITTAYFYDQAAKSEIGKYIDALNNIPSSVSTTGGGSTGGRDARGFTQTVNIYGGNILLGENTDIGMMR